jgi:hypothetical protein
MRKRAVESVVPAHRFNVGELFDRAGRLRPLGELPREAQAEIAFFEIVRVTTHGNGETVTTEELIRVKTRDRRTAQVQKRGGAWASARMLSETASAAPGDHARALRGLSSTPAAKAQSEGDARF